MAQSAVKWSPPGFDPPLRAVSERGFIYLFIYLFIYWITHTVHRPTAKYSLGEGRQSGITRVAKNSLREGRQSGITHMAKNSLREGKQSWITYMAHRTIAMNSGYASRRTKDVARMFQKRPGIVFTPISLDLKAPAANTKPTDR